MLIPYDPTKVIQAAAVLLKAEPSQRISRLRLLKLLYIADRESLIERTRPITGDRVVAMDHGPVLSNTYNLMKGRDFASPRWDASIAQVGKRDMRLREDPGVGELSRYEIAKLQDVSSRHADKNDWELAELTHDFPEWKKHQPDKGTMNTIPLSDLLEAVGISHLQEELEERGRIESTAKQFFEAAVRDAAR